MKIMKYNHIKYIIGSLALLITLTAYITPPNDLIQRINKSLDTYRINYAPEKIYIHHDKPYYMAGEVLWLKAYVVDAISLKPTQRSGVVYIDLYNEYDEKIERLTLPVSNGEASGDFILPDDLSEGVYRLSAFTQYMRNFGEEIFFQKEIMVLSASETFGHTPDVADPSVDLQFFPEGGDLVAGIQNRVAFKAVDASARGMTISASLFDENGVKILEFKDTYSGMGSFTFTPDPNKKYFAKLNFKDGQTVDYPLPASIIEGFILQVDEITDPDNILIQVSSNKREDKTLNLFAIADQKLLYSEEFQSPNKEGKKISISKTDLPTGITRITLTAADGEPLAERLAFVRHPGAISLEISPDKPVYKRREEVKLGLNMIDGDEKIARLSMTVTAEDLVHRPSNQENIQTYLLLSSDLKGYVESPGYYFENNDLERQTALQHLLMTQGWRKFGWDNMLAQDYPSIRHPNEVDLNIRGQLVDRKGEPIKNGQALLFLKDRFQTFITTETNADGYFTFRGFYFTGNIQVVIQGSDDRGRTQGVEVKILEKGTFPLIAENYIRLPKDFAAQLPEDYVVSTHRQFEGIGTAMGDMDLSELLLEEVVVEGRAEIQQPFRLHHEADMVLHTNQLPVAPSGNILESLQGRVAGLQVTRSGMNTFQAVIRGQGTPLYLLDGMPISEESMQMINQFDINRIEILKRPGATGIYGGLGSGGVIALFTDIPFEEAIDLEGGKHIIVERISGFSKTRQFYIPSVTSTELPDLRSTIYWNPSITLTSNENKEVRFTTADTPGTYRVIIEGLTENGKPLFKEYTFDVN